LGRDRRGERKGGEGSWAGKARGAAGLAGVFLFFYFLHHFLFLKPFPNKILNVNKFKPKENNTKKNILQHECINKFLIL